MEPSTLFAPQSQPKFCQYAGSACNENFLAAPSKQRVFFAFASEPPQVAESISLAVEALKGSHPEWDWLTWQDLDVSGQLIFCQICKNVRASSVVVADITSLNFNLMFEIGFVIGLGVPLVLIRDTSFNSETERFKSLGLLETIGYTEFQNSSELASRLPQAIESARPLAEVPQRAFRETPVYVVRSKISTDGSLAIESALKKSRLRYRTYDPKENIRLTLNDARRQVDGSLAVIANLLDNDRRGALFHNALCAFVAGYAVAKERVVALLQQGGDEVHPIDYRDIVIDYEFARYIPTSIRPTLDLVYDKLQSREFESPELSSIGVLRELDLGDVAAENEIWGLQEYFVPTGQSISARRGHSPLVIGRKGSGKSALFYDIRNTEGRGIHDLVLDLRPEGHQFTRVREFADANLSRGMQEFALNGFWTYLLLTEIARKLLENDRQLAKRDTHRFESYRILEELYSQHNPGDRVDFPQRLVYYVERLVRTDASDLKSAETIMQNLYAGETRPLRDAVIDYLRHKDSVWLLIDNLDKGSPVGGSRSTDVLLIRSLLDAMRTLRNDLESANVEFRYLVFLRSDIYEHLVDEAPDKGKDSTIRLDWDDPEALQKIVERRIVSSTELRGDFRSSIWSQLCAPLVGAQHSFDYLIDRTLLRPRDLLMFLHRCVETSINRGHNIIEEDDMQFAENGYSNDMLLNVQYEMADLNPAYDNLVESLAGASAQMELEDARLQVEVMASLETREQVDEAILALIRYGVLGVVGGAFNEATYAFSTTGGLKRLKYVLENDNATLIIHPAFRAALGVTD
ncbi:MAG: hypothetical protein OXM54_16730 [Acidimicrobiaceae bacterium]|nr:hypothetical protein [Acidimicrobiaceae bacterium]